MSTSETELNLYCQDRCYQMKGDMADTERAVCLQMISCHNMFSVDFYITETLDLLPGGGGGRERKVVLFGLHSKI